MREEICAFCKVKNPKILVKTIDNNSICFACIRVCFLNITSKYSTDTQAISGLKANSDEQILYVQDIIDQLSKVVIGQEEAVKSVAIAAFTHAYILRSGDDNIERPHMMLYGPSGSGKTLIAKTLAKIIGIDFIECDATALTQTGYVGMDVSDIYRSLWHMCDENMSRVTSACIFIDEFDKIGFSESRMRNNPSEGVQDELLKMVEGKTMSVNIAQMRSEGKMIEINTRNNLFIFGGAFDGLRHIVRSKQGVDGLGVNTRTILSVHDYIDAKREDFVEFGMTPELMWRIPNFIRVEQLSKDSLRIIMLRTIEKYVKMFKDFSIDLSVSRHYLESKLDQIKPKDYNARNIHSIVAEIMKPFILQIPNIRTISL